MRRLVIAAAAAVLLAGCGGTAARPAAAPATTPAYTVAPHVPMSPEAHVCLKFGKLLPRIRVAVARRDRRALMRYNATLGHWSHAETFTSHDATLANDLADGGFRAFLSAGRGGIRFTRPALRDLGKAARYCQDNVTDAPLG